MMGSPNLEKPVFGMVTNGDGFQFIKLSGLGVPQYDVSEVFSPIPLRNRLYEVLRILKQIGGVILEN